MDYVPYAVPFFLLAILIEFFYGFFTKKNTYRANDERFVLQAVPRR